MHLDESYPNGGHNGSVSIPKHMAWRNSEVFAGIPVHGKDRIPDVGCKCRHASIYAGRSGKFAEISEY